MNVQKNFLFVLLLLWLNLNCSKAELTYTVEEIDGVRLVHNHAPKWGDSPKISLEFIRKMGGPDAEDENLMFFRPTDIAVDARGNFYVLDGGNFLVKKFAPDGKFILSFGEKGNGPGEFSFPAYIGVDDLEQVYVNDLGNRRLTKFSSSGKVITSFASMENTRIIEMLTPKSIVMDIPFDLKNSEQAKNTPLTKVVDFMGNRLFSFGKRRAYGDMRMASNGNYFYITNDKEGNIFLAFLYQNRIEKYSQSGELLMKIDRDLPFEESETFEYGELEVNGVRQPYNKTVGFSSSIRIDNNERIWVLAQNRPWSEEDIQALILPNVDKSDGNDVGSNDNTDPFHFEIFDSEGILQGYLGGINGLRNFVAYRIYGDRLFIIDKTIDMDITEYRIVDM